MPYFAPPSSGPGYTTIQDETTPLTARTTMNFTGGGVTATDTGAVTQISIPSPVLSDGDYGEVVVSGSGTVMKLDHYLIDTLEQLNFI